MNKFKGIKRQGFVLLVFLLFGLVTNSLAKEEKETVNLNMLIEETQQTSTTSDRITMVWWIPDEYWITSLSQQGSSKEEIDEVLKFLGQYTIILVVDGDIGKFGGVTYKSKSDLISSVKIKDNEGKLYKPIKEKEVDPDTANLLGMMGPIFSSMLGPMGENMHFFLFPSKNKNGDRLIEAKKKGSFSVKLGKDEFKWRLPLDSLFPGEKCPKCKENRRVAWNFCPWCGEEFK